ncbi:TasA family protein [Neobacillus sp. FSL H8-0543]|uniref:TasA family protein n=1 Tax=Neobacillus sp. FSL H8-0543 TaxID=2954672 RepID=UPI00315907CE
MAKKSKLGMGIASSALALSLIAGGTYALFSANAVNAGNEFTAGTVKITDYTTGGNVASQMINFSNLAPGDTDTKKVTIKNEGTLDAWVRINDAATQATRSGELFNGATPLQISYSDEPVFVGVGQTVELDVKYSFPLHANDSYQSAKGSINVVVDAVQARNNDQNNDSKPDFFPSPQTFITPADFNVTAGHNWTDSGRDHKGFSFGFILAESPKAADVRSITIEAYKDNTLLQRNTAGVDALNSTETSLSTPFEFTYKGNSADRFADTWWNYGDWQGSPTDKPTKVVITIITGDGHTYTATRTAY